MVEVYKTNVTDPAYAQVLLDYMQQVFPGLRANFDLQDCDHILRVQFAEGDEPGLALGDFLQQLGCLTEALPEDGSETAFWYHMLPEDILSPGRRFSGDLSSTSFNPNP